MEAPTFPEIYGDLPDHKIIEDPQSRMRSWKREKALRSRQNHQVAAADALRKAQIKNANQHYEYEVRRAEAQYCEDFVDCDAISIMKAPRVEKSMLTARSSSIVASSFARSAATSEIPVLKLDDKLIR